MILNFVLLIWEEQNLGCYEHAHACQERAKKICQPSNDIPGPRQLLFPCGCGVRFSAQLTGESYYSTSWYVYSVLKKVPEYRYPLYRSTGIGLKKLFLSIVFTILKKSYIWNIQPVRAPHVSRTKKIQPPAFTTRTYCMGQAILTDKK